MNKPQIKAPFIYGCVLEFSLKQYELLRVRLIFPCEFFIFDRQLLLQYNQLL